MSRGIRPIFSEAQARGIRLALKAYLEWEDCPASDARAMANALRQLDTADRESRRQWEARQPVAYGQGDSAWCTCGAKTMQAAGHAVGCPARGAS